MRRSRKPIRIASRVSPLAQAQARQVGEALHRAHGVEIEYHGIESAGDQQADAALTDVGGKGLFARAVEQLVLDGTADLAVHSYKDLPSAGDALGLADGLVLGSFEGLLVGDGVRLSQAATSS